MSPNPRSVSPPIGRGWSGVELGDHLEGDLDGKFALITPVSTSRRTLVAKIRWIPAARAIWVSWVIESSTSPGRGVIIRSASSSMRMRCREAHEVVALPFGLRLSARAERFSTNG